MREIFCKMEETMCVNQFEDIFYINDKTIIINYLTLAVREYEGRVSHTIVNMPEEDLKMDNFLEKLDNLSRDNKVLFTIVPSYNCNMRCTYCYEGRHKQVDVITHTNFKEFLQLIKAEYMYDKCEIVLLGGEPVYKGNINICHHYIKIIKSLFEIEDITCITNGLEIKKYYKELQEMGITKYQITLDGSEKLHNLRRPSYNKEINSFKEVCESISFLLRKGANLEVRINIDDENVGDILYLIELCFEKNWYKFIGKNMFIYLYPVSENGVCTSMCYTTESKILKKILSYLSTVPRMKRIISIRVHGLEFIDSLFHNKLPIPVLKFCGANSNQFVFAPDGYVYPCWWGHNSDNRIGCYSENPYLLKKQIAHWRSRSIKNIEECQKCKYRLICGGGCTYKVLKCGTDIRRGNCADFYNIFKNYLEYFYNEK